MQTRRKREAPHEDAAETEKPRRGAKKRVRPVSSEEEKPEQAVSKRSRSHPQQQSTAKTPSKKGRPARTAGKKGSKDGKKGAPHSATSTLAATGHESEMKESEGKIKVNRAPVLTLWVAVVAAREGYSFQEGLSFGKAIAGLLAQSKGRRLGLYEEPSEEKKEERNRKRKESEKFPIFGMNVPGKTTQEGLRLAVQNNKPMLSSSVADYLHRSFGADYERVKGAMEDLANSSPKDEIGKVAYSLYEKFRPNVPYGVRGWGAKGFLDIEFLRGLRKV